MTRFSLAAPGDYSTVTFYDTDIEQRLAPDGWAEWSGRLKSSTYREYDSHGPGVNGVHRIVSSSPLSAAERDSLNPRHCWEAATTGSLKQT